MTSRADPDYIRYEEHGRIAVLRLDRADKKNAINEQMRSEIRKAVERFANAEEKVLVVTGLEDAFSAGTDINDLRDRLQTTIEDAIELDSYELPETIASLNKPTIAMINGIALGGGFELALACDIRVAATDAEFGFPEITIGGIPGEGGTQRLATETNDGIAKRLVLSGDTISAERALQYGIVQDICPPDDLASETFALAERIAEQPLSSLMLAKQAIDIAGCTDFDQGIKIEGLFTDILETTAQREELLDEFLDE